jgi:predicted DNA-binding transcriptional regulator AlpA
MTTFLDLATVLNAACAMGSGATLTPDQTRLAMQLLDGPIGTKPASATMSVDEVCAVLHIGRHTLWRLRRSGEFIDPIAATPGRILFLRADFEKWLAKRAA